MELTINCGAFVEINKLLSIAEMNGYVDKYKLDDNFLEGTAVLKGKYVKDDSGETYDFYKEVPFTVVFKDKNVNIKVIDIVDLHFSEVINQGIETTFEILVDYDVIENKEYNVVGKDFINQSKEKDFLVESKENEKLDEIDDLDDDYHEQIDFDDILEDLNELKDEITKDYEELLDDILLGNNRDTVEVKEMKKENNRVVFTKFKDNYSTYRVYYPKDEKEVEKICGENNKSLDEIYRNNSDLNEKRRIILK